ncbi:ribokinase [Microbacterium insulae]|uniref:Ribokinase n=1 Tax=Microbacterium insulae TaxID=483014 RepID=A0ABW3AHY9_9MICO
MGVVVVVGSANRDLRIRQQSFARPGETCLADDASFAIGGKGLNQAVAARRAGADVAFVAAVGQDATGDDIVNLLRGESIDTHAIARPTATSGLAVVTIVADGENSIVVVPGANAALAPAHVDQAIASRRPSVVLLQQEIPAGAVRAGVDAARRAGALVVLNAAPVRAGTVDLLAAIDVLIVNDSELADLAVRLDGPTQDAAPVTEPALDAAAARIARDHDITVVHTRGSRGAALHRDGDRSDHPAVSVEVVDTTAAGDTFAGYLAAALARGAAWDEAMTDAATAAAVCVSRQGSADSIPDAAATAAMSRAIRC